MRILPYLPFVLALASSSASASLMHISGSGIWDGSVDTTDLSAPGLAWTLSFDVDSPIPPASIDTLPVSISNAVYTLDGTQIGSVDNATFYTTGPGGLFSVFFSGPSVHTLDFYGPQIVNVTTGELSAGNFSGVADINLSNSPGGHGAADFTISATASVPEPASLALFGLGLVGLGWARRKG